MKLLIYAVYMIFFLFGCSDSGSGSYAENAVTTEAAVDAVKTVEADKPTTNQMLIKRGNLSFQTPNVDDKHVEILQLVKKFEGYIANENSYSTGDRRTFNTEIRLPKQHFDSFVNELSKGISHFDHKEISVEDVTEEFVDIQARLKTKKELEARYLELLSQARNVTEMLEIEKQIGELQADIESIEGRIKYLSQQVDYATLNLSYYEQTAVGNQFGQQFINGFRNGWNNLIWFFVGVVNIWPFIVIFSVFLWLFIRWRRKG